MTKRHIALWKETAQLLAERKTKELRGLTEMQAAEQFIQLSTDVEAWRSAERRDGAGLIEQQRWFLKAHEARRRS